MFAITIRVKIEKEILKTLKNWYNNKNFIKNIGIGGMAAIFKKINVTTKNAYSEKRYKESENLVNDPNIQTAKTMFKK